MKKLLLIDANSLIHRCYHALPPWTNTKGESTHALYGLSSILLKILRDHQPDYVAAAFDRSEPTFRDEMYKEYKAHRKAPEDSLVSQLIKARDTFKAFGIFTSEKAGFEADDIIATLAEKFRRGRDIKIIIFSGDKDNLQLIDDDIVVVELLRTGVSKTVIYNKSFFIQQYGFGPEQFVDYKSLIGDASDNIPGVKGIGPKGATDLIKEYPSLEGIYENIALISKKVLKEKLEANKETAFLSKKLATMKRDVPLDISLEDLKQIQLDKEKLLAYFKELGFKSLVERL